MKNLITVLFVFAVLLATAQNGWEWEPLTSMPEPVSNNAVTHGYSGDTLCIYSFTGISEGLEPSDIHLKSWRYNTILDEWQSLPDVDDFQGVIAAGASTVNNVIYLIGGYHVYANFNEDTSPLVHRFDCETNTWMSQGEETPVPIDDQVQAVWRDSLIFVVTGWSNNTNVADVQIYDPSLDSWSAATSVPNTSNYKAFGASGTIVGDTIYYFGGARITINSFVASNYVRKGVINPENPTEIAWEQLPDASGPAGYRMASFTYENEAVWIGGSPTAYNFDGLSYSNGSGVDPLDQIRLFRSDSDSWEVYEPTPYKVMDLRGIAQESADSWIIAGGMEPNQVVSDRVFRIRRGAIVGIEDVAALNYKISQDGHTFTLAFEHNLSGNISIVDVQGAQVLIENFTQTNQIGFSLNHAASGIYFGKVSTEMGGEIQLKIFNP